ncbi:hypothetical protein BaRGS_00038525, partial [Batillaria attramentaria]
QWRACLFCLSLHGLPEPCEQLDVKENRKDILKTLPIPVASFTGGTNNYLKGFLLFAAREAHSV